LGRTRSSNRTADRHLRILEKGGNSAAYFVAFRFQLCDYPVQVHFRLLFDSGYRQYAVSAEQLQLPRSLDSVGVAIHHIEDADRAASLDNRKAADLTFNPVSSQNLVCAAAAVSQSQFITPLRLCEAV